VKLIDTHAFAERPDVRGVRDFGVVRYLDDPSGPRHFEARLKAMEKSGLLLDLDCDWEHMGLARRLADAHPGLRIVLGAFLELIAGYRTTEQEAMCSTTAEGLYFS
jgi:predicted TIM-barrel fold metal-dependent hydrolase